LKPAELPRAFVCSSQVESSEGAIQLDQTLGRLLQDKVLNDRYR